MVIVHHVRLFYDGVTIHWSVNGNVNGNVSAGEIQNGVINKQTKDRKNQCVFHLCFTALK